MSHLGRRCCECGRLPLGRVEVSLNDEVTCVTHPYSERCYACGRRQVTGSPGWAGLGSRVRCPTCSVGAVDTQVVARRYIQTVRADLGSIGLRLQQRVRVALTPIDEVTASAGHPGVVGLTEQRWRESDGHRESTVIKVMAGLPPTRFQQVVAHEVGHAWLGEQGAVPAEPWIEEGVCELFSAAWLKKCGTPFALTLREQIRTNPDPVDGEGFRRVHAAVVARGIAAVLTAVCSTGRLDSAVPS